MHASTNSLGYFISLITSGETETYFQNCDSWSLLPLFCILAPRRILYGFLSCNSSSVLFVRSSSVSSRCWPGPPPALPLSCSALSKISSQLHRHAAVISIPITTQFHFSHTPLCYPFLCPCFTCLIFFPDFPATSSQTPSPANSS